MLWKDYAGVFIRNIRWWGTVQELDISMCACELCVKEFYMMKGEEDVDRIRAGAGRKLKVYKHTVLSFS